MNLVSYVIINSLLPNASLSPGREDLFLGTKGKQNNLLKNMLSIIEYYLFIVYYLMPFYEIVQSNHFLIEIRKLGVIFFLSIIFSYLVLFFRFDSQFKIS